MSKIKTHFRDGNFIPFRDIDELEILRRFLVENIERCDPRTRAGYVMSLWLNDMLRQANMEAKWRHNQTLKLVED